MQEGSFNFTLYRKSNIERNTLHTNTYFSAKPGRVQTQPS